MNVLALIYWMDASEKYIRATDPHIYFELALLRLCNQEHAASQKIEYTPIKEEPVKPVEVKKVEVKEEDNRRNHGRTCL